MATIYDFRSGRSITGVEYRTAEGLQSIVPSMVISSMPLRELVRIREAVGPVEIQRVDQSRVVPVFADVTGGTLRQANDGLGLGGRFGGHLLRT